MSKRLGNKVLGILIFKKYIFGGTTHGFCEFTAIA